MTIDVKCLFAVKHPHYGKVAFDGMTEDEVTWLIDLVTNMLNSGIIQDYHIEALEH